MFCLGYCCLSVKVYRVEFRAGLSSRCVYDLSSNLSYQSQYSFYTCRCLLFDTYILDSSGDSEVDHVHLVF
jgi:hypothetical protein